MKIVYIKVDGGRIAKNPMTGNWFVYIGEKIAADFICKNKRDAIAKATGRASA
jgi:hypothetical protein